MSRSCHIHACEQVLQESSQILEVTNSMSEPRKKQRIVGGSRTHKVSCSITDDAQSSIKSTYHTKQAKMLSISWHTTLGLEQWNYSQQLHACQKLFFWNLIFLILLLYYFKRKN
jgi:hypothetical protein